MAAKNNNKFDIDFNLSEADIRRLFEPHDPLEFTLNDFNELEDEGKPFDPIDWEYLYSLCDYIFEPLLDYYYRARIVGFDNIPDKGPLIVASNHSGNAFPHDAMVLDALLWRESGMTKDTKFRSVFTPKLAATWWMRPFAIDNWWRRGGGVDMKFDNYNLLLKNNHRVIYYPEGVPGIGKGFTRRYQLQHFYSSFVVLAARHHAPVCPVCAINAEWVNPTSLTFKWLNKLFDKLLGLPFFPVPIIFFTLLFPFIFYLAFPCNMTFVVGSPVDVRKKLREIGADPDEAEREDYEQVAELIRADMQKKLDKGVTKYGKKPYDIKSWLGKMKELGLKGAIKFSPLGWPFTFVQHARNMERPDAKNKLHAFLRDLDIAAYYLPFGWFIIALLRQIRKPPYGYRGLTKKERRKREGKYLWLLKKRPMPGMKT